MRRSTFLRGSIALSALLSIFLVTEFGTSGKALAAAPLVDALPSVYYPEGTYRLGPYGIGRGDFYVKAKDPQLVVVNQAGKQTQHIEIEGGSFQWTLLGVDELVPFDQAGTFASHLSLFGINFSPTTPVKWRPLDIAGFFQPNQTWSWTVESSNGGVTLNANFRSMGTQVESINGIPTVVQWIRANLNFSGNVTGSLQMRHYQQVHNSRNARFEFEGTVSALGDTESLNTAFVLGTLKPYA